MRRAELPGLPGLPGWSRTVRAGARPEAAPALASAGVVPVPEASSLRAGPVAWADQQVVVPAAWGVDQPPGVAPAAADPARLPAASSLAAAAPALEAGAAGAAATGGAAGAVARSSRPERALHRWPATRAPGAEVRPGADRRSWQVQAPFQAAGFEVGPDDGAA